MLFRHFELSNIEVQAIIAGFVSYLMNRVLRWHHLRRESGGIVRQLRALLASLEDHCINTEASDAETHFIGVLIDEIRECAYSAEAGKALWRSRQVSAFYDDVSSVLSGRESFSCAVDDDGRRATLALIAVRARTARSPKRSSNGVTHRDCGRKCHVARPPAFSRISHKRAADGVCHRFRFRRGPHCAVLRAGKMDRGGWNSGGSMANLVHFAQRARPVCT